MYLHVSRGQMANIPLHLNTFNTVDPRPPLMLFLTARWNDFDENFKISVNLHFQRDKRQPSSRTEDDFSDEPTDQSAEASSDECDRLTDDLSSDSSVWWRTVVAQLLSKISQKKVQNENNKKILKLYSTKISVPSSKFRFMLWKPFVDW